MTIPLIKLNKYIKNIDLTNYSIKNVEDERSATYNLMSQMLFWMKENGYYKLLSQPSSSMIINKIVYFASKELNLRIGSGWYKYGPCFENGRQGEESLSINIARGLEPGDKAIDQVQKICEEHVPLFSESLEKDGDYPYQYLKYVYEKKNPYQELKEFYIKKHELAYILKELSYNYYTIKDSYISKFDRAHFEFELAITDRNYYNKVGISRSQIREYLKYSIAIKELLTNLLSERNKTSENMMKQISYDFINKGLMLFAHKNYAYTFDSFTHEYTKNIQKSHKRLASISEEEIEKALKYYYGYYRLTPQLAR